MASRARQLSKLLSSDLLTVDVNNSRIGVNSTSPAVLLDVEGNTDVADTLKLESESVLRWGSTNSATIIGKEGASGGYLAFSPNNEKLRITSAGRVGIGTDDPTRNVELNNASGNAFISVKAQNTGFAGLLLGDQDADNRGQVTYSNNIDAMILHTAGTEQARITGLGSFGIGTINPLSKLSVTGVSEEDVVHISVGNTAGSSFANIRGDNEAGIRIRGGGSFDGGTIELAGGLRDSDPGIIKFSTGTSADVDEALRIDVDGNLKLGTSTLGIPASGSPPETFFVGRKSAIRSVTVTATLDGSGDGTFDLGRIHYSDDESFEILLSICTTANTSLRTTFAKAYCQKVRGTGLTNFVIDRQGTADSGFSVSSLSAGTGQGVGGHGLNVNVTGGDASTGYTCTALIHVASKNNLY